MIKAVESCGDCPFEYSDDVTHSCRHPSQPLVEYPAYFPGGSGPEREFGYVDNEAEGLTEAPPWCPLRTEPITVTLKLKRSREAEENVSCDRCTWYATYVVRIEHLGRDREVRACDTHVPVLLRELADQLKRRLREAK